MWLSDEMVYVKIACKKKTDLRAGVVAQGRALARHVQGLGFNSQYHKEKKSFRQDFCHCDKKSWQEQHKGWKVYLGLIILEVSVHRCPTHCSGPELKQNIMAKAYGGEKDLRTWQSECRETLLSRVKMETPKSHLQCPTSSNNTPSAHSYCAANSYLWVNLVIRLNAHSLIISFLKFLVLSYT